MKWNLCNLWLSFAVIMLGFQIWSISGAPPYQYKDIAMIEEYARRYANQNQSNATMVAGVDQRMRTNVTNPCIHEGTVCLFFVFCELGTIKTHPNGLAFRGLDVHNLCPFYDDVCCTPSLPVIKEHFLRVEAINSTVPQAANELSNVIKKNIQAKSAP